MTKQQIWPKNLLLLLAGEVQIMRFEGSGTFMDTVKGHILCCGATMMHHVWGAVSSVDLALTGDDVEYLEDSYTSHDLVCVMADNKVSVGDEGNVWQKHTKNRI